MDGKTIGLYALVFVAVLLGAYTFIMLFAGASRERGEMLDERAQRNGGVVRPPIERLISPGKLFQLQFMSGLLPALGIFVAFACSSFKNYFVIGGIALAAGLATYQLPRMYYMHKVNKRYEDFSSKVLDLTMGLANGMKAGMALPQCLDRISQQMGGVMQDELTIVLREYRVGADLVMALQHMQERMPSEDLRLLTCAIKLTTQSGGSLVEVLKEMVDMIRSRTEFQEKLKTLTAQGRFEAIAMSCMPLVAFGVLYLINDSLMVPLVTTPAGWVAICVMLGLMTAGYICINKIITIEV